MVQIDWCGTERKSNLAVTGEGTESTTAIRISFGLRNDGKSPAWILEQRARMSIVDVIPNQPQFGPLASNESEFLEIWTNPMVVGEERVEDTTIYCKGKYIPNSGPKGSLIVYGYVKYRDIFQQERYTGFGFVLANGYSFKRIPSVKAVESYNRFT